MKNLTFNQYRAIDLTIMSIMTVVFEAVTAFAATKWFPGELYAVSPTIALTCIVMMRWGGFGAINAVLGGFTFCVASGASEKQILIYAVGNCFSLLALFLFKAMGKAKIKDKFYFTALFVLAAYVGAQIGRWLVGLVFGGQLDSIVMFLATDCLSLLFSEVIVLISRRVDGLFEDQKSYLIRLDKARKKKEAEEFYNQ